MFSDNLYKKIDNAKIVSFDIFDTLLLRPYMKPSDMFLHIGKICAKPSFYKERTEAENKFYKQNKTNREANIDDIYSVIPQYAEIKKIELALEYQVLDANQEIVEVYNYALKKGKTVIITSDMYLPCEFIEKVLEKNNITDYFKLYLSNQINKRKDNGSMYDYIIGDLNVSPEDILHIGDNKQSDYKQAKKHKLNAYIYRTVNKKFFDKNINFKNLYAKNKNLSGLSIFLSILAQSQETKDYWVDFGYTYAGIIVLMYAKMIYNYARNNNLKDILFVARDGYIIEKVFNIFNKSINTHYVYAPRILNYTSNLDYDFNSQRQSRMVCEYFKQDTNGKPFEQYVSENWSLFKKLAEKEKQQADYKNYIHSLVSDTSNAIGVVDTISGQLSAQKLIENESGIKTIGFYFLTLFSDSISCWLEHHDFLDNNFCEKLIKYKITDLLELIFSAPENPIITVNNGKPVYQKNITIDEMNRHLICKKIEIGVLNFVHTLTSRFGDFDVFFEPQIIPDLLQIYIDNPAQKDIKAMNKVKVSPFADNSVYEPLFSADIPFWKVKECKKLIWQTPMQYLFCVLSKPLSVRIRCFKSFKITFFPLLKSNIFSCCIANSMGFYIGGGKHG